MEIQELLGWLKIIKEESNSKEIIFKVNEDGVGTIYDADQKRVNMSFDININNNFGDLNRLRDIYYETLKKKRDNINNLMEKIELYNE